ncbi:kinase-like domain-containing protein, partial [Lactarius hatsudake]
MLPSTLCARPHLPAVCVLSKRGAWVHFAACPRSSQAILNNGIFPATAFCLGAYGGYCFTKIVGHVEQGLSLKVDYLGMVDDKRIVLVEAKSPSVMKAMSSSLPEHTIELDWTPGESKVLLKAALYLGLRKTEWLFLTSHNNWIVCRLVGDKDNPFLTFSPMFSIEGSSEPFRAFLGAILSVLEGTLVQASKFNPTIVLDTISEEGKGGSMLPMTRSRATTSRDAAESESDLMFTLSSPHYPESFQVWVHLYSLPNNTFVLPHCAENRNSKRRLWLTRHIGCGSTGNVWECHFVNSDDLFAIKAIKLQHRSDVERQRRSYNEFEVYLSLEIAYQSGQLRDCITPHCYGAFEGDGTDILILGLCGDTLKDWDELNFSEQTQIYWLVRDLHRVGIVHGDLEPRNIARVPGGGFRLIDFSDSVRHSCVEIS